MLQAPRRRVRAETTSQETNKVELQKIPEVQQIEQEDIDVESWRQMIKWLKLRLGELPQVQLTDSDLPYLHAILRRGSVQVLERTYEGKHFDKNAESGFVDVLRERPELIDTIRESVLEYFMTTQAIDLTVARADLQKTEAAPRIVFNVKAKQVVASNEHYGRSSTSIPEVIGKRGERIVRLVMSIENLRHNTVISFHPRADNTLLQN